MKTNLFLLNFILCIPVMAIQVVSESQHTHCTPFEFQREIKIYKDPSFFVPDQGLMYSNPKQGWEELMEKSPVLTTLKGSVHLMILGNATEFKNFGEIAKLYEIVDARFKGVAKKNDSKDSGPVKILPIKVCGQNEPYSDSLGFVVESDLKVSQTEEASEGRLPPSTIGRPIPKLPKNLQE